MTLKQLSCSFFFLGSIMVASAQDLTHLGLLPRINYVQPVDEHFSLNVTAFSEIDIADNTVGEEVFPSRVINLTLVTAVGYKINANNIITAGYLFRVIDPFRTEHRLEHRVITQYVKIHHLGNFRLRHHFRFEERFIEAVNSNRFNAITRLSYSLGWDVPLQGEHLNANEFYLNSISSYYVQPTKPRTAFNNLTEFYLGLGYKTENIGRFEIGPEAKLAVRNTNKDLNTIVYLDLIWYPEFSRKKK